MIETVEKQASSAGEPSGASPTDCAPSRSQHFLAMDGLRGIAAGAVAIGHLHHTLHSPLRLPNTGLAVDFFFMLSGFVLAYAYADRIETSGFRAFLLARIVRLYPMIVAGVTIALAYFLVTDGMSPQLGQYTLAGVLLLPTLKPNNIDPSFLPLDPPAWSLFFEMVASILFGLGAWRGSRNALGWSVAAAAVMLTMAVGMHGTFDTGWSPSTIGAGLARVCFGFGAGVLLYRLHSTGKVPRLRLPFALQPLILSAVLLLPALSWPLQLVCASAIFPLLLLGAAQDRGAPSGFCRALGELSYPLYVIHWPIYLWVGLVGSSLWTAPLAFLTASMAAYLLFKVYDEPVRSWLNARIRASGKLERGLQAV